jgi:putative sterol carrier protein
MLVPPDTTIESLVTDVIPALHARLVPDEGPSERFSVAVRIEGCGSWTARIVGRDMQVDAGEEGRPTLWMYMTKGSAERLLADAVGPRRLLPEPVGGQSANGAPWMGDPRVIKRLALANGRIELAAVDEQGSRLAVVLGLGDATRRPMAPEDPDTIAEAAMTTLESMARGEQGPEEALSNGAVTVRGSRLLALQLALAVAPFYKPTPMAPTGVHVRDRRW